MVGMKWLQGAEQGLTCRALHIPGGKMKVGLPCVLGSITCAVKLPLGKTWPSGLPSSWVQPAM